MDSRIFQPLSFSSWGRKVATATAAKQLQQDTAAAAAAAAAVRVGLFLFSLTLSWLLSSTQVTSHLFSFCLGFFFTKNKLNPSTTANLFFFSLHLSHWQLYIQCFFLFILSFTHRSHWSFFLDLFTALTRRSRGRKLQRRREREKKINSTTFTRLSWCEVFCSFFQLGFYRK